MHISRNKSPESNRIMDDILKWYFDNYCPEEKIPDVLQLVLILQAMGFEMRRSRVNRGSYWNSRNGSGRLITITCSNSEMEVTMESPEGAKCRCPPVPYRRPTSAAYQERIPEVRICPSLNRFAGDMFSLIPGFMYLKEYRGHLESHPRESIKSRDVFHRSVHDAYRNFEDITVSLYRTAYSGPATRLPSPIRFDRKPASNTNGTKVKTTEGGFKKEQEEQCPKCLKRKMPAKAEESIVAGGNFVTLNPRAFNSTAVSNSIKPEDFFVTLHPSSKK